MALYAVERVDDAFALTRAFLFPFDAGRWLRLAVMALFVGGSSLGTSVGSSSAGSGAGGTLPTVPAPRWVVLVGLVLVGIGVVVGLLVAVVAATFEFAFVESLRTERVAVREYVGRFWRRGVGLFAFQVGLVFAGLVVVVALAGLLVLPALVGLPLLSVLLALAVVPALLVVVAALAVAGAFTTALVVPVALAEDLGVVAAWRRFWPTLRAEWKQFGAFAVVQFLLAAAVGVLASAATLLPVAVLALPFGLLFALGVALPDPLFPLGVALMGSAAAGFAVAVVATAALVQVPVQAFLRFYALAVLGDVAPQWDLLGERRQPLED